MRDAKSIISATLRVILILFLVVLILLVTSNIYFSVQKNANNLRPTIFNLAPMYGNLKNMEPVLNENDFILIQACNEYKIGDTITYLGNGEYVTQIVCEIEFSAEDRITCYKVQNPDQTGLTRIEDFNIIYGKQVLVMRGFAPIVNFFQSIAGMSTTIVVTIILIFLPEFIAAFRKHENDNNNNKDNQDNGDITKHAKQLRSDFE